MSTTIASAAVAGVLGLAGISVAGAAGTDSLPSAPAAASTVATTASTTPSSTTVAPGGTTGPAADPGARAKHSKRAERRRHRRRQAAKITAQTINITPRDLVRELRGGKTIAQIATEHGVQPQAVIDALESAATARIDAAQAANKITAERAARLKQRVADITPRIVNNWHPRRRTGG